MFCPKCGKQLPEGSKFCPQCGFSVSQGPQNEPQSAPQSPVHTPSSQGGGNRTPLIIALILAAIAIVALAAALFLKGGGKEPAAGAVPTAAPAVSEAAGQVPAGEVSALPAAPTLTPVPLAERAPATLLIRQVDNSAFPLVSFYSSVLDAAGQTVGGLSAQDFTLTELVSGTPITQTLTEVTQVQGQETCSVSLVLDASGSMDSSNKIAQAKAAAQTFLSQVNFAAGDQVEVVSFSDYVYLEQDFTSDYARLSAAIDNIQLYNMTALYDALYSALVQTYAQDGARCVIGFTDGMENGSSYTFQDVAALSQSTGIPVYLVGIGAQGDYDAASLRELAHQCSGEFYSAQSGEIATVLAQIYAEIYRQQQEYYVFRYTSANSDVNQAQRALQLSFSDYAHYQGSAAHDFQTQAVINGNFGMDFRNVDFILPQSSIQEVTSSDLAGLSLAQLRIARNEIYARHGRQFKDPMLNQWFYSKNWYLGIHPKYSPSYFDSSVNDLSALERKNVAAIKDYENAMMATSDIFPNASAIELTQYDLALSKAVLQTALDQMRYYRSTPVLQTNIALVQSAMSQANIQY